MLSNLLHFGRKYLVQINSLFIVSTENILISSETQCIWFCSVKKFFSFSLPICRLLSCWSFDWILFIIHLNLMPKHKNCEWNITLQDDRQESAREQRKFLSKFHVSPIRVIANVQLERCKGKRLESSARLFAIRIGKQDETSKLRSEWEKTREKRFCKNDQKLT